jgi:AcrR family transcriptional regulator
MTDDTLPRGLASMWGRTDGVRPGPRPALTVADLAAAGTAIADAEGLAAVSMSRVAKALGYTTMSLYRYVESKDDLVAVLVDHAYGPPDLAPAADWRPGLQAWAHALRDRLREHPWVLHVVIHEPPLGPNQLAWMDLGLRCLSGTGLTEQEKLSTLLLLDVFVRGQTTLATSMTPEQDVAWGRRMATLIDAERFPALCAAAASGSLDDEDDQLSGEFAFGLDTVLDGVAARLGRVSSRR